MEFTFPLFRLPENAIVHVLQNMNLNQLFKISLVSSKTKNLVSSLGFEASDVSVIITRSITVSVYIGKSYFHLNFYDDSNDLPLDITLPVAACFDYQRTGIQLTTPLNFSDWLNHIKIVFSYTKAPNAYFHQGCERFGVQSLKNVIGNVHTLFLSEHLTDALSRKLLELFKTPSNITIVKNPFEEACEVQKLFIQNFEIFNFYDVCSLDDMLLVNSEIVNFCGTSTHKQFNRFVKHWIRGSNSRLQYMSLSIDNSVSRELLLKGIHFVDVAEKEQLEISQKYGIGSFIYMMQIRRKDGTSAVISTKNIENMIFVSFIV